MPTSTSSQEPLQSGKIPSIEEQEAIKNTIQLYFEIRYRALSMSDSNDFKQNGFGDLISDLHDADVFLQQELGKLQVEIKRAELDHLRYAQYKFFLDFRNIVVDISGNTATLIVIEENEVIYDLSQQLNPKNPLVTHRYNVEHMIVLHKEQDQWKIVSDNYNDYLWAVLRRSKKTPEEILNDLNMREVQPISEVITQAGIENTETVTDDAFLLVDNSTHPYNRDAAVDYALKHANNYNLEYYPTYDGEGGDCTNFVSQSIYEGGNASMFIPSPLPAPSPNGQSGWYLLNEGQRASAWNDVGAFYTFVTSESFLEAGPGVEWYGEGPQGYLVDINQIMKGDVIQYEDNGDSTWDHAVIVVDIVNGVPQVASHSDDFDKTPYTTFDWVNKPALDPTHIRFIHIERSNGNPPVKSEIEGNTITNQSSDDAGTNPTGCVFSATNNEVYLGQCFGGGNTVSGFRFNNVQIPQDAQIKYAYVTFAVDGQYTDTVNIQIYGDDVANSSTFTTSSPPSSRPTPSPFNPVLWDITEQWNLGTRRGTPDISSVIEKIVSNHGWVSGNSLSLIFKNTGSHIRRVIAFERANTDLILSPARLIVAYGSEDVTPPSASSIVRSPANPNLTGLNFTVTFSESVTGVDIADFILNTTGVSGANVTSVNGSGNVYTVNVNSGSGSGTIQLNLLDDDSIIDSASQPLGGAGTGNGNFLTGQSFTVTSLTLNSLASQDGHIVESTENSGVGGTANSTGTSFVAGDATSDRQYVAFMHFDTSTLPDTVSISSATVKVRQQGAVTGTNPFTTHGNLLIDIQKPYFGTSASLVAADFQAVAGQSSVATFISTPINSWYSAFLNSAGTLQINLTGTTQLRIRFSLDDNDDNGADYIAFASGNNTAVANRPQLIIQYYMP
ncbi:MAG: amidase domain-containing protein [Anaerolineales bacterium]|nr:amidase domain-containing protein [Anaerolineales bacterium]